MNVTAIIQARIGGTRLPGKVLKQICGVPMLRRVVERVSAATLIDRLVVAIPSTPENDGLAEYVIERGWSLYRGPEQDVLARYYEAAKAYEADQIVRVTADEPFLDPGVLNGLVSLHLKTDDGMTFTTNNLERTWPLGLDAEVFSFGLFG